MIKLFLTSQESDVIYLRKKKSFSFSLSLTELSKGGIKKKNWTNKASASSWEKLKPWFEEGSQLKSLWRARGAYEPEIDDCLPKPTASLEK